MSPALTEDEVKRRGQAALDFYTLLKAEPGDDFDSFTLPAPAPARTEQGIIARVQRLLYAVFAP